MMFDSVADVMLVTSLVPRPSHTCEKEPGSGVLSDFSCHMGQGHSAI